MNREIKFRAWDDGKMIYEKDISHLSLEDNPVYRLAKFFCNVRNDSILMQFTGLNDKNGKDVYEGDILKSFSPSVPCYEVFYDRCCFRLRYKLKTGEYYDWGPLYRMEEIFLEGRLKFHPEVIGNIYQNPELLNSIQPKKTNP